MKLIKENLRTVYRFLSWSFLLYLILNYLYVLYTPGIDTIASIGFVHLSLFANTIMLYIIPISGLFLFAFIFRNRTALQWMSVVFLTLFFAFTFVDITIYRLYKFHFNGMVWKLLTVRGTGDTLHLSLMTLIVYFIGVLCLIFLLHKIFIRMVKKKEQKVSIKRFILGFVIFLLVLASDKFIYAYSNLYSNRSVTRFGNVYPMYQKLTIKSFAEKYLGYDPSQQLTFSYEKSTSGLKYPIEPVVRPDSINDMNIIWIAIDSWRYDMLNPEVSPNLYTFAQRSHRFTNHYSGGNGSRFGVFSMFYSLYGYYWHPFLNERIRPVFINELKENGYDFQVLSSTSLYNPEFRSTCFIDIQEYIQDSLDGVYADTKDISLTKNFISWLESRDQDKPFFSFLFYDAPHMYYRYPKEYEIYTPSLRTPNYVTLGVTDSTAVRHAYMNAIRFDDDEVAKVLEILKDKNLMDNTIIVITGDHGEEFYESGNFGHTSAFSKQQTKVPMIMYVPDALPKVFNHLTSHLDLVPTMLSYLGYSDSVSTYSQGKNLFDTTSRLPIVAAAWDKSAIIGDDATIIFSYEMYNMAAFEVRDSEYKLLEDENQYIENNYEKILNVLKGFEKFIR
ncbi:MAG: DUF3413 domain-containing protein [Calditrichaeota bacterium]|nr:MAG: DUF3413 domain-containing protein [Calditrichota bacterium]